MIQDLSVFRDEQGNPLPPYKRQSWHSGDRRPPLITGLEHQSNTEVCCGLTTIIETAHKDGLLPLKFYNELCRGADELMMRANTPYLFATDLDIIYAALLAIRDGYDVWSSGEDPILNTIDALEELTNRCLQRGGRGGE